jgi:hypothetical protein
MGQSQSQTVRARVNIGRNNVSIRFLLDSIGHNCVSGFSEQRAIGVDVDRFPHQMSSKSILGMFVLGKV